MQTALIITGLVIASFVLLSIIGRRKMKNIPLVADNEKILTLGNSNFQHQLKNKVVLVDFWASWCAPCRMMAPVLNEIAGELDGKYRVGKVNIEQHQTLARDYKVRSIPTMVLYNNGQEIKRFVGVKPKEYLLNQIKSI
jgi:thioredoxin 1